MKGIIKQYKKNKTAKVGEICFCPSCGAEFVKGNYQQAFCKTKGGTVCKDRYWNTVTPQKRCNTTRISPANENYYNNVNSQRQYNDDDGLDYLLECGSR